MPSGLNVNTQQPAASASGCGLSNNGIGIATDSSNGDGRATTPATPVGLDGLAAAATLPNSSVAEQRPTVEAQGIPDPNGSKTTPAERPPSLGLCAAPPGRPSFLRPGECRSHAPHARRLPATATSRRQQRPDPVHVRPRRILRALSGHPTRHCHAAHKPRAPLLLIPGDDAISAVLP